MKSLKARALVATVLVAIFGVWCGLRAPVLAAGGGDGCNPLRAAGSEGNQFDGWYNAPSTTVGGVYANIYNYSPWVSNVTGTAGSNESVVAWTMLTNASDSQDWAQVGWLEWAGNHTGDPIREVFVQIHSDGWAQPYFVPFTAQTQDTSSYYTTLFSPNGSGGGSLSFQVGGATLTGFDSSKTNINWTPNESEVFGEVLNIADQMPGDERSGKYETMEDSSYYASGGWHAFYGAAGTGPPGNTHPNIWGNATAAESGKGGTVSIWDRYCPVSNQPSAIFDANLTQQEVFWQTQGNTNAGEATYGSSWSSELSAPFGTIASAPATIYDSTQHQQVAFWQGTDGKLWENYYSDSSGTWASSPVQVGGGISIASAPGALYDSHQQQQVVFWKGADGNLYETYWHSGTGWSSVTEAWDGTHHAGPLGSAPTAVFDSSNNYQLVWWKGTDGQIYEEWWTGSWNGPGSIDGTNTLGTISSAPAAAFDSATSQDIIFYQGTASDSPPYRLHEIYYTDGVGWTGQSAIAADTGYYSPSTMESPPTVAFDSANGQQLIFWKQAGELYEAWFDPSGTSHHWHSAGPQGPSGSTYADLG